MVLQSATLFAKEDRQEVELAERMESQDKL